MNPFLTYFSFLVISSLLISPPLYREYQVLDDSKIVIKGTTNVTGFSCYCDMKSLGDIYVKYEIGRNTQRFSTMLFPVRIFDCGGKMINKDFLDLVKADEFPHLDIRLKEIYPLTDERVRILIEAGIAGKKNRYSTIVKYKRHSNHLEATGKLRLNIENFGLEQPKKMMGLVVIDKEIEILFNLKFRSVF